MRLADLESFIALKRRMGQCEYCGIYHPVLQCKNPKNASNSAPSRTASSAMIRYKAQQRNSEWTQRYERRIIVTEAKA